MSEKPYTGAVCSRRVHRLKVERKIEKADPKLYACGCGATLIGNGITVVREDTLEQRFPLKEEVAA